MKKGLLRLQRAFCPRQYSCALHRQKLSSPLLEECLRLLRQS
ncbi:MAG: hypothetical protein ACOYJZ_11385 [Acutalibacter sp.]|jgi:hypothetical protein